MAKFYGAIGYAETTETTPGNWVDVLVERPYTGDVIKLRRNWRKTENVNSDLTMSDTISIIANDFAINNIGSMKYVRWRNQTWTIESVEIERPRMTLMIGGLYNGDTADVTV